MTLSDPRWLWALLAVPLSLLLELWASRRVGRWLHRLVGERSDLVLLSQREPRDAWVGAALRAAAIACLALGAAGPEWGREVVRRASTGSDVVLLIDVSASMDARDVPPSRIDEARREALAVLDRLQGSRVGVVAFAGDAVRLCPLTLDAATARLVVESLSSGSLSTPGSDLGRGLSMALRLLPRGSRDEQAVVVWTDGEDLERGARAAIEEAAGMGVRMFVVGVGTSGGDVVPVLDGEGHLTDVKRDENGNVVRSRLDEGLLRMLAQRTHGAYFSAHGPGGELGRLLGAVGGLARSSRMERLSERPVGRFRWFAIAAALLLALERGRRRQRRQPGQAGEALLHSERTAAAAAALVVATLLAPGAARGQSAWARGDRAFREGRYAEADSLYGLRLKRGGPDAVRVNRATARALTGRPDGEKELERLSSAPGHEGGTAGYNLGTLRGRRGEVDPALEALRAALEKDPRDEDARWNYEVMLRRREQSRNPQQQPQEGGGGGGGAPPSPPQPSAGNQGRAPAPTPTNPPPGQSKGSGGAMTREQAERLLHALEDVARAEQRGRRDVRAERERKGKDW